jgi:hypothetical protein
MNWNIVPIIWCAAPLCMLHVSPTRQVATLISGTSTPGHHVPLTASGLNRRYCSYLLCPVLS